MAVFTEGRHPGEFLLSEASRSRSRANLKIPASQTITPGLVLAALVAASGVTAVATADAANAADTGEMTLATPAYSSRVKHGRYVAECIAEASDAGTFRVEDPEGKEIGNATVGVAFNKEVKFTIADGTTDFSVGEKFYIDVGVEEGDLEFVPFDQDGEDGSEVPAAIALYGATTGEGETASIAGIVRDAEVNGNIITWPDDLTAAEQAAAIKSLEERGIIVR